MQSFENFPGFFSDDEVLWLSEGDCPPEHRPIFDLGVVVAELHSVGFIHGDLHGSNIFYDEARHVYTLIDLASSIQHTAPLFGKATNENPIEIDLTKLSPDITLIDLVTMHSSIGTVCPDAFPAFVAGYSKESQEYIDPIVPGYTESLLRVIGGRIDSPYKPLPFHRTTHQMFAALAELTRSSVETPRNHVALETLARELDAEECTALLIARDLFSVLQVGYMALDELYHQLQGIDEFAKTVEVHRGAAHCASVHAGDNLPLLWSRDLRQSFIGEASPKSTRGENFSQRPIQVLQILNRIASTISDGSRPAWVQFIETIAECFAQLLRLESNTVPLDDKQRELITSAYQVLGVLFQILLNLNSGQDIERRYLYLRQLATFLRERLAVDPTCWSAYCKKSDLTLGGLACMNTEAFTGICVFGASLDRLVVLSNPFWSSAFQARNIFHDAARHLINFLNHCRADDDAVNQWLQAGKLLFANYASLLQRMIFAAQLHFSAPYARYWEKSGSSDDKHSIGDEAELIAEVSRSFSQGIDLHRDLPTINAILSRIITR